MLKAQKEKLKLSPMGLFYFSQKGGIVKVIPSHINLYFMKKIAVTLALFLIVSVTLLMGEPPESPMENPAGFVTGILAIEVVILLPISDAKTLHIASLFCIVALGTLFMFSDLSILGKIVGQALSWVIVQITHYSKDIKERAY